MLFLNPLAGAAIGAGAGALTGNATDYGINDDFIRGIGKTVPVGSGAVFLLADDVNLDKLLPRLQAYGGHGRIIQTSLSNSDEDRLRNAFSAPGWAGADAAARSAGSPMAGAAAGAAGAAAGGAATVRTESAPGAEPSGGAIGHHDVPPEKR